MKNKPTNWWTNRPNCLLCYNIPAFFSAFSFRGKNIYYHGTSMGANTETRKCLSRKYYISHKKEAKQTTEQAFAKNVYTQTRTHTNKIHAGARIQLNIIKWHTLHAATLYNMYPTVRFARLPLWFTCLRFFPHSFILDLPSCLLFIYFSLFWLTITAIHTINTQR